MKSTIVTALVGCFVYGGILFVPTVSHADTLTDMVDQLNTAWTQLQALQTAGGSTTEAFPQTKWSPMEPTYVYPTYTVSMTGYNAVAGQTDDTPDITSIGLKVNPEIGAAASRDLIKTTLPYGTVIELVPGAAELATGGCELPAVDQYIQYRVITDTMAARHTDHVDVLFSSKHKVKIGSNTLTAARAIGWCKNVEIRVVGHVSIKQIPATQKELQAIVAQQLNKFADSDLALSK